MGKVSRAVLIALVVVAVPSVGRAHDADLVYAAIDRGPGGEVREKVTLTGPSLALLAPIDADGDGLLSSDDLLKQKPAIEAGVWDAMPLATEQGRCSRESSEAILRATYVELRARFSCPPGELRQTFEILSVLPSNYKVVLGTFGEGGPSSPRFAEGNAQTLFLGDFEASDRAESSSQQISGFLGWVELGVIHIFGGPDHLAFLIALLLVSGTWKRVLVLVTTFTVAHSITLGATALGYIPLTESAQRWVEAVIALSIVYVAIENLVVKQPRHRMLVVFSFGLIHGFGFASVLQSYGLEASAAKALLGFNLGVELGQAAVVVVLFPILQLATRRPVWRDRTVKALSLLILVAGAWWLTDRVLG